MKKSCVKMICSLLSVVFLFGMSFSVYAENLSVKRQKAISFLLNAGWTTEEIYDLLTDEAILEFAKAKAVVSSEKKFFRVTEENSIAITEEECMEAVNSIQNATNGISVCAAGDEIKDEVTTTDGYLTYYVEVYSIGGGEYMIGARFEWLIEPLNRRIDVFAINHCDQLTQISDSDEVYYVYKADYYSNFNTLSTMEINEPDEMYISAGHGTAITQNLLGSQYISFINHRGYLQYKAEVNNTTATILSVNAEYLHQQGVFGVSPSISFGDMSIGVDYSTFFKRMSPNPYLTFSADF